MCIAIYQPKNIKINYALFSSCWRVNPDGGGFAVRKDGKIEIHKGFMTLKEFWSGYKKYNGQYDIALHFRITTHGMTNAENCHPFPVGDGAFLHNGTIPGYGKTLDGRSDTREFCEDVLSPCLERYPRFGVMPYEKTMLEACLDGSKAVLMYPDETVILNEIRGLHKNGAWYSNNYPFIAETPGKRKKKYKYASKYWNEYESDTYESMMNYTRPSGFRW